VWRTAIEPDKPEPRHLLAACTGQNVPERASEGVRPSGCSTVVAPSFDAVLETLEYKAPALVAEAVGEALQACRRARLDGLLECRVRTGLAGSASWRPYARGLVGLDLSKHMLGKRKGRGCYDELVQADLTESTWLSTEGTYDLIRRRSIRFCYFGDLREVVRGVPPRCDRAGIWYSPSRSQSQTPPPAATISSHGRYSHTEAYLRSGARDAGLCVQLVRTAELRLERTPVQGLVVVANRVADYVRSR